MNKSVDRTIPSWGKVHPIPELEEAIAIYLEAKKTWDIHNPAWKPTSRQAIARTVFIKKAHDLLGVKPGINAPEGWNSTVDALDHYRDDWRGEVVPLLR